MKLWLLRHPPTKSAGICIGQSKVALTLTVEQAVESVLATAPLAPTHILSSDLPRCRDLATALSLHWNATLKIDERVRELSMGDWEGKSFDDLNNNDNERWQHWCDHWQSARPPGGENLHDLENRVQDCIRDEAKGNMLLVGHAGVIRCLWKLTGMPWSDAMRRPVPHLSWQLLELN